MVDTPQGDLEGVYTSLSGRQSSAKGLISRQATGQNVVDSGTLILNQNGARVYAVIRNSSDSSTSTPRDLWVQLGNDVNSASMLLRPGDALIIDRDHPWSGPVSGWTTLGVTSEVDWLEVSIA